MNNKIFKYMYAGLIYCGMVAIVACSSNDDVQSDSISEAFTPTSVTINVPEDMVKYLYTDENGATVLPLIKGQTAQLTYKMEPEYVTFSDVEWSSSVVAVATVTDNGLISAVDGQDPGYSVIKLVPEGVHPDGDIRASLKVTVDNVIKPATSVSVSSEGGEVNVYESESLQLSATITPSNTTYRTVTWSSGDESIATVDANGVVTAKNISEAEKKVKIYATALDGSGVVGVFEITVKQIVQPQDVTINISKEKGFYLCPNEKMNIPFTTVPEDCAKSQIVWTSSNTDLATVENGVLTVNKDFGEFTLTATCPATGKSSSVNLEIAKGCIHESFEYENYTKWLTNSSQASTPIWKDGYLEVKMSGGTKRGDLIASKAWLSDAFPIIAIRMDVFKANDASYLPGITKCNINFDAAGGQIDGTGTATSYGNLQGNNGWKYEWKRKDGTPTQERVIAYDMSQQSWSSSSIDKLIGNVLFKTLTLKYADVQGGSNPLSYNIYWIQSFKSKEDLDNYLDTSNKMQDVEWEVVK